MPIKKTVFGSRAERENFYKLSRQWGDRYRIWHNLPFLNVIEGNKYVDWSSRKVRELSPMEFNRLKKTSIDYVLCEENGDRPILGIEFDGMNDGYNVGTRYLSEPPPDPGRAAMMEQKLRVAHGNSFPYFVLGSKHFDDLGEVKLMIVDGIIGEVLAKLAAQARFAGGFQPTDVGWGDEEFAELSVPEQDDLVQDWVLGVEVENDCKFNPLIKARFQLQQELGVLGFSQEPLYSVTIPPDASLQQRVSLVFSQPKNGTRVTIKGEAFGTVSRDLWLPNFQSPCFGGLSMAREIAHIMALVEAKRIVKAMESTTSAGPDLPETI